MPVRKIFLLSAVTAVLVLALARGFAISAATGDWDQIIAAAKREGKIALIGPPGAEVPAALTHGFQKKYPEIQAEFSGLTTQQATTRLRTELAAGVYQADIFITGTTTALDILLPAKAIVPIKSFLVGPNVVDTSKWKGEKFIFSDDAGTYNLVFTAYVNPPFTYNPNIPVARRNYLVDRPAQTKVEGPHQHQRSDRGRRRTEPRRVLVQPRRPGQGFHSKVFRA